jgi:hypothetical protein
MDNGNLDKRRGPTHRGGFHVAKAETRYARVPGWPNPPRPEPFQDEAIEEDM